MTAKSIYITGDSFCFHRTDPINHWPARLAQQLDLDLAGAGYPGQGWWPSRMDLLKYKLTAQFANTNIFVFCHTDIYRPLTANRIWERGFTQDMWTFHMKYILDYEVNDWAAINWYQEINDLLQDRLVVHLHCFDSNRHIRSCLSGRHMQPELVQLSELGVVCNPYNHFTAEGNQNLADAVYQCIMYDDRDIDSHGFESKCL